MSCEHHGHCHHHETDTQAAQLAQRLGDLCCRGQCQHIEHRMQMIDVAQLHAMEQQNHQDVPSAEVKPSKKKKRQVRSGFLQSLVLQKAAV